MTDDGIDREPLLRVFFSEGEDLLSAMESAAVALERTPDDRDLVNTLFRGAHTLKGNASSVDLPAIVEVAHATEDLLDQIRAHRVAARPEIISLLLQAIDALRAMVDTVAADIEASLDVDGALLSALREAASTGVADDHEAAHAPDGGAGGPRARTSKLRIDVAKLDSMLNLTGEIVIARARLANLIAEAVSLSPDLAEAQERLDRLCGRLQDDVTAMRMLPIGPVLQQQARTVRDASHATGKLVHLEIDGERVEVDTAILEQIRDPLTHMVRNAVAHGIEAPTERVAKGKPAAGRVGLRAAHDSRMIVIEVSDDGAGLDLDRIAVRGRELGLIEPGATPTTEALQRLIFAPGVSTANVVTETSGRGVGMDVVHQNVTALRGTIAVSSQRGVGTTFTVRLPLTLTLIEALSVGIGPETFVIPLDAVTECIDLGGVGIGDRSSGVVDLRGTAVPFLRVGDVLGVARGAAQRESLVVVRYGERVYGLVIDRLLGRTQVVLKPIGPILGELNDVAGAIVTGDGNVALMLDVPRVLDRHMSEVA